VRTRNQWAPEASRGQPVVTICEPAAAKVMVCTAETLGSLFSQTYVTVPGPLTVMVAKQLKFLGHPPVNDIGSTLAVTLVTANVGGGGGGGGSDTPETIT